MTIRRAPRPNRYSVVPNSVIEDTRLSFKALGLLVYLLSKPDHWSISREHLVKTHSDGSDSVRSALRELRAAGYITDEVRRGGDGKIADKAAVVHDTPQLDASRQAPPTGGKPTSRDDHQVVEPPLVSTDGSKPLMEAKVVSSREQLTLDTRPNPRAQHLAVGGDLGSDRDLAFVEFWNRYPRKEGKGQARKAWAVARRRGVMPETIVVGAERYRDDPNRDPAYTKHAATWLNGECWDDEPLPDRRAAAPTRSRMAGTMAALQQVAGGVPREDLRGQLPTKSTNLHNGRPALGAGS